MGGSNLATTYKRVSKDTHKRDFIVKVAEGDPITVTLPRLSIRNRAKVELFVQKHTDNFTLAALRSKAALVDGKCRGQAIQELITDGLPETFKNDSEAGLWGNILKAKMGAIYTIYVDTLFEGLNEEDLAYGVMLAIQQIEGSESMTVNYGVENSDEEVLIDIPFVDNLLSEEDEGPMLPNMFFHVANVTSVDGKEEDLAKTPQELLDRVKGDDSGNEETEAAD